MIILPQPKEVIKKRGKFYLLPDSEIILQANCNSNNLESAYELKKEIKKNISFSLNINKSFNNPLKGIYLSKDKGKKESYYLNITKEYIEVIGADDTGLFYGVQTLKQLIRINGIEIPCLEIKDKPYFKVRGFYHDVTRGKVPTLETLKKLVDKASFYKLNQLQLYIEHTFAFKKQSEIWIGADPLTSEEILLLDEYCRKKHIELVPSLSSFGHLYHALTSQSFTELCELNNSIEKPFSFIDRMGHHTLDVTNPKSIEFVKSMFKEFIPLFSSNKFNICADETFDLGKGKSKHLAKRLGVGRLYVNFLNKIIKNVKKYGKQVMFWGDIILKYPEFIKEIPKDVICLNWDYSKKPKEEKVKIINEFGLKQYVCPGVSGWNKMMNNLDVSFSNIKDMVSYGKKYEVEGVLNTNWGDYGNINFLANSIPGMIYGAALSWNTEFKDEVTKIDEKISKIEYKDTKGELVSILRDLSNQQIITWAEVIWWKEHYFKECIEVKKLLEFLKEKLNKYTEKEVHDKYKKACEIQKKLLKIAPLLSEDKKRDLEEFYISAKGISLINSFYLILKDQNIDIKINNLIYEPAELADELEKWFLEFSKLWRGKNKESELFRIKDTIIKISNYLRKI
ncbi:MAG: glycosyl hydrolase family 20 [Firmicutes bacterium]|nr:glycosyl hydrolase family 20 [Bacillota bacterium]